MNHSIRSTMRLALIATCLCAHAPQLFADECPELVGRWPYGPSYAVAVSGSFAYFGSGTALVVADISNPATPLLVGELDLPGVVADIAVANGHAYVADGPSGFRVIDVSTPSMPVEVGSLNSSGDARGLAISGGYAYVVEHPGGFHVIDVSDPAAPTEVGVLSICWGQDVATLGRYAYVVDEGFVGCLIVVDVDDPGAPVLEGYLCVFGAAAGVAVVGDVAYVAGSIFDGGDYHGALCAVDVSTPSSPTLTGFALTPLSTATSVATSREYGYVTYSDHPYFNMGGLFVADLSASSAPVEVGFFDTTSYATGVAASDGYVFVTTNDAGMYIFRECGTFADGFESGDTSRWSATVP